MNQTEKLLKDIQNTLSTLEETQKNLDSRLYSSAGKKLKQAIAELNVSLILNRSNKDTETPESVNEINSLYSTNKETSLPNWGIWDRLYTDPRLF